MQRRSAVIALYFALLCLCAALIIGSEFLGATVRANLLPIASDGFKLVLGALVGALSALMGIKESGEQK
ncbi:hypothetical protein [Mesorhizobium sp. M0586]|uniref:hypothetical protein n=1 Tax=unclassified Mesorhizobium TaxID=325217 RepID=UPI00333BEAC0